MKEATPIFCANSGLFYLFFKKLLDISETSRILQANQICIYERVCVSHSKLFEVHIDVPMGICMSIR